MNIFILVFIMYLYFNIITAVKVIVKITPDKLEGKIKDIL